MFSFSWFNEGFQEGEVKGAAEGQVEGYGMGFKQGALIAKEITAHRSMAVSLLDSGKFTG